MACVEKNISLLAFSSKGWEGETHKKISALSSHFRLSLKLYGFPLGNLKEFKSLRKSRGGSDVARENRASNTELHWNFYSCSKRVAYEIIVSWHSRDDKTASEGNQATFSPSAKITC